MLQKTMGSLGLPRFRPFKTLALDNPLPLFDLCAIILIT
jgi:hypothetical protein